MRGFLELLGREPAWLRGVVYGPQTQTTVPQLGAVIPPPYQIRDYPDITHSRHCQYPVPDWDVAFALTEGREVSNPRPTQTANIFRLARPPSASSPTLKAATTTSTNASGAPWVGTSGPTSATSCANTPATSSVRST